MKLLNSRIQFPLHMKPGWTHRLDDVADSEDLCLGPHDLWAVSGWRHAANVLLEKVIRAVS